MKTAVRFGIFTVMACIIAYLSLKQGGVQTAVQFQHIDKVMHFSAYFAFCVVMCRITPSWRARFAWGTVIFAFSGLIEILQGYVGRDTSLGDLAANGLGIAVGLLAYKLYCYYRSSVVKSLYSNG